MKRSFEKGERLRLFTDEYRTPLFVGDLIQVVRRLCEKVHPGMFHVAGRERISRHDFGLRFAAVFGFDPGLIDGVSVEEYEGVRRAKDVSLNIDHTAAEFGIDFHAVLDGLDALKRSGKGGQS
jgi:dTDP-4-dehydrorhamnose reductase